MCINKITCLILFFVYCLPFHTVAMVNKLKLRHSRSYDYKRKPLDKKKENLLITFFSTSEQPLIDSILIKSKAVELKEVAREFHLITQALARTNLFFNRFINDDRRTLYWIKQISQQCNVSNFEVACRLGTKAAKNRFALQKAILSDIRHFGCGLWYHESCIKVPFDFDVLHSSGLDFDFTYDDNQTTLLIEAVCIKNGYHCPMPMKWLLDKGADINKCNIKKQNSAMIMFQKHCQYMIEALLEYPKLKININDQDIEGNTLLHYCIEEVKGRNVPHNRDAMMDSILMRIKALLDKEADPTIKNKKDQTPLELGLCSNNLGNEFIQKIDCPKIINLLQEAEINWKNRTS